MDEKIGQMTQVDLGSIRTGDVTAYGIGSILSGGSDNPQNNIPQGWQDIVNGLQKEAMATRLKIPMIYGIDATHGNAHLYGATVFPQESGIGATHDPALAQKIGQATAEEMLATGIPWTFSPIVAVPQDIRWGRTDESYSEDTQLTTEMARPISEDCRLSRMVTRPQPDKRFSLWQPPNIISAMAEQSGAPPA